MIIEVRGNSNELLEIVQRKQVNQGRGRRKKHVFSKIEDRKTVI